MRLVASAFRRKYGEPLRFVRRCKDMVSLHVGSRLVNVRLDPERLRKAQALRERGVALSDVVREAIDERFAELHRRKSPRTARAIIQRLFEQYPDPPDVPPREYDVHDRRAARGAILRRIRRVRP